MDATSNSILTIGIFGVGAIGAIIASTLVQNESVELIYYNRSPKDTISIQFNEEVTDIPIVLQREASSNSLDYLIICLKEHQYAAANPWFKRIIHPNTTVVVIRNGLMLKEPILAYTVDHNILECIVDCPTQLNSNGVYLQFQKPILTISASPLSTRFKKIFDPQFIQINLIADFKTASWKKLIESASLGAIQCLHAKPSIILQDINIQQAYKDLLDEGIKVARANGAKIGADFAPVSFHKVMQYPPNKGSSMLTDRLMNRTIELGAKNGIIVKLGQLYHIDTPLHQFYCNWIRAFNNGLKK